MCVWLANLQPETQKPILELFGQPRARSKPTNEERELSLGDQEHSLRGSGHTNRIGRKVLTEFIPNTVHSGLDRGFGEPRNLRAVCVGV